jgi:hypothetical protein
MRVDAAQTPESALAPAIAAEVGDRDLLVVANDGKDNLTLAVDDDPDLTSDFVGEFGEIPGELLRDDFLRGDPSAVDALQALDLACL